MNSLPPVAFGYTHGGEDDTDWGCVFRSVQNVQAYMGMSRVWTVRRLVHAIGRSWGSWSEPADFARVNAIFPRSRFNVRALLVGSSRKWLKLTSADQYERDPSFAWNKSCGYVIDDGVSGYALVPWGGELWFIDPHSSTPKPRRFVPSRDLSGITGLMVLEVCPR